MDTCRVLATIGGNIRETRRRAGYGTGKAFAKAMGVDASRVSEWETDTYQPKVDTLLHLAKFLRVSVDDLLAGVDSAYEPVRLLSRRDLVRQTRDLESGRPQDVGGPLDEAASARLLRLERENAALRTALDHTEDVVSRLGQIAGDLTEARDAALAAAGRRADDRKTG